MLLVGSFWGRAGGLIALGLVAAHGHGRRHRRQQLRRRATTPTPRPAPGEVQDSYDFGGGEFMLDLSDVADVDALDGRDIAIDGVGGRIEVVVPDGMDVDVDAPRSSAGDSRVFDQRNDGFDITLDGFLRRRGRRARHVHQHRPGRRRGHRPRSRLRSTRR